MAQVILVPFEKGIATVHPNGVVDIRLVDDVHHTTLTGRMSVETITIIAEHVNNKITGGIVMVEEVKSGDK